MNTLEYEDKGKQKSWKTTGNMLKRIHQIQWIYELTVWIHWKYVQTNTPNSEYLWIDFVDPLL